MKLSIVIPIALCAGCTAAQQPMNPQSPAMPLHKQTGYTVLHSFSGGDGSQPMSDLLLYQGNLYGTTAERRDGEGTLQLHGRHGWRAPDE